MHVDEHPARRAAALGDKADSAHGNRRGLGTRVGCAGPLGVGGCAARRRALARWSFDRRPGSSVHGHDGARFPEAIVIAAAQKERDAHEQCDAE